jgi:hypothetical protein
MVTIYCDESGVIQAVGYSDDPNLTAYEVTDGTFDGWSREKMLCYRCTVKDGEIVMLTPATDSRLIRNFDYSGKSAEENEGDITDAEEAIAETYEQSSTDITDLQEAIAELYEMITGGAK